MSQSVTGKAEKVEGQRVSENRQELSYPLRNQCAVGLFRVLVFPSLKLGVPVGIAWRDLSRTGQGAL